MSEPPSTYGSAGEAERLATRASKSAAVPTLRTRRRVGLLTVLVLGSLTAVPSLSTDMYLPALPKVAGSLHATTTQLQLTLTAYLAGMAVGQFVIGPVSDALGRRRPLLVGIGIYTVASAACVVAPDATVLTTFRLVQGLAGAAGVVIARAVVRDLYSGLDVARFLSSLMLVSGVAPIAAPVFGGQLLRVTSWRGVFLTLTVVGAALIVMVAVWLAETLPARRRHTGGLGDALRTIRALVRDTRFTGYVLTNSFSFAALFAYVSGSTFVIQDIYGASPQAYSLIFGLNSIGLVTVGQINGKVLVGRVPLDRVLTLGLGVVLLASAALVVLTSGIAGRAGLVSVAAALFVLMSSMGLVGPTATAQALIRTPHAAGAASALLGTMQFLIGSAVAPLPGLGGKDTALPMAVVMVVATLISIGAFTGLCRPWRHSPGG